MASIPRDDIDILVKAKRALPDDYAPGEDEEYMSEAQLNYFRVMLLEWKKSILEASVGTLQNLQDGPIRGPDLNDRASSETDWGIELRTRDRQRKLIAKIDSALRDSPVVIDKLTARCGKGSIAVHINPHATAIVTGQVDLSASSDNADETIPLD